MSSNAFIPILFGFAISLSPAAERIAVRPLAIKGEGGEADWVQLSRKHVIEVNEETQHLSIFGGKLTDCLPNSCDTNPNYT